MNSWESNKLGGGETESYRRVPDPHYSEKGSHKARGEYHRKNTDKTLRKLYDKWLYLLAFLPQNKEILDGISKDKIDHPPFP